MLLAGSAAALHYSNLDLALSHYDARAHLVVSRRIFDSLMPGWQQIGAVWLPLPHLLNMLPVQVDALYRSGASAIAISVSSMAIAAWALARLVVRSTGSTAGALAGAALLLINPNLLYIQSTPMTEPLLFAAAMVAVMLTAEWVESGATTQPHAPGLALAAACLTRYEGWPITVAVIALAGVALVRVGSAPAAALRACVRLTIYPAAAILLFVLNSRWTTGYWLVTGGFFVAENEARGQGWLAWRQVRIGVYQLSTTTLVWSAYASTAALLATFFLYKRRATLILLIALVAAAALPWYAYLNGHPLRIRYSLPLAFAACALSAAGIGLLPRRLGHLAAVAVVAAVLWRSAPLDLNAPLVREAQRDTANRAGRRAVTAYLARHYDDALIMMSMGSLAHYMHDLAAQGFDVRDSLHEGNGELWPRALEQGPRGFVGWLVVEEQAEGGDALFHRAREARDFYRGFERVAEGGGVALYKARTVQGSEGSTVQKRK